MSTRIRTSIFAAAAVGALVVGSAATASAEDHMVVGHTYEATNNATGNALAVFDRFADGSLEASGQVATGGLGAGVSLNSQGGVARDGHVLFVVNAGDDSVSALAVSDHGLELRDRIGTDGAFPVSVTVRDGVGYVLNQGSDTIRGFRYDSDGHLHSLPGSTRSLTPNPAGGPAGAAEVSFTPDGRNLVVTEKATNLIDTFTVSDGYAGDATPHPSAGTTPYGFAFDRHGHAIVSEAATGSASSYRVRPFAAITRALSTTQRAACWVVVAGSHAYVVNAASSSISSYRVAPNGALTLTAAVAASTGAGPTDAAVSPDQRTMSVRLGDGSVASFHIEDDGALTTIGTAPAIAQAFGIAGLVAD
ncbi:MAG: lactonase family protein [Mycobacteriaceae bacterium]